MVFTYEDKIIIKHYREVYKWGAKKLVGTFPENNWQKKEQHEQEVHGGKQSKLFDSQSLIRKDLLR